MYNTAAIRISVVVALLCAASAIAEEPNEQADLRFL